MVVSKWITLQELVYGKKWQFFCGKWHLALLFKRTMTLSSQRLKEYLENYFSPVLVGLQQLLNTISASSKEGTFSLLSSASKLGKHLKIKASVGSASGQTWTALVQLHKFKVMGNFWFITSRILLHFSVVVPWKFHKK